MSLNFFITNVTENGIEIYRKWDFEIEPKLLELITESAYSSSEELTLLKYKGSFLYSTIFHKENSNKDERKHKFCLHVLTKTDFEDFKVVIEEMSRVFEKTDIYLLEPIQLQKIEDALINRLPEVNVRIKEQEIVLKLPWK